ncbi:ATP-grasp fold amidoligase family protein [Lentibacillus kapialis]|nr:ATP-grasp fold amidoligase family protein [Lentibacillus kapialis]
MKDRLKSNSVCMNVYHKVFARFIAVFTRLSPYLATKYLYKKYTGKRLNLKNPQDFNEKIQWLKLYWQHPLVAKCGDKYDVRNYAKEVGCSEALIESFGVYDDATNIDWDELPQKFILKVTSASTLNMMCDNKSTFDYEAAAATLNRWLKVDYGLDRAELHYSRMTPRILCERLIETHDGKLPIDYKIFCFNGSPELVLVALDRATEVKRFFFDLEWNSIHFEKDQTVKQAAFIERPRSFNDMVHYAKKLAAPFPFVRVDFYDDNGKALLGEMTFTPDRGMASHYNENMLSTLGDMIKLPQGY